MSPRRWAGMLRGKSVPNIYWSLKKLIIVLHRPRKFHCYLSSTSLVGSSRLLTYGSVGFLTESPLAHRLTFRSTCKFLKDADGLRSHEVSLFLKPKIHSCQHIGFREFHLVLVWDDTTTVNSCSCLSDSTFQWFLWLFMCYHVILSRRTYVVISIVSIWL